jgi:hypothetical protein
MNRSVGGPPSRALQFACAVAAALTLICWSRADAQDESELYDALQVLRPFRTDSARARLARLLEVPVQYLDPLRLMDTVSVAFDTTPCPCHDKNMCRARRFYRVRRRVQFSLEDVISSLSSKLGVPVRLSVLDAVGHAGQFSGRTEWSVNRIYGTEKRSLAGSARVAIVFRDTTTEWCGRKPGVHGSFDVELSGVHSQAGSKMWGLVKTEDAARIAGVVITAATGDLSWLTAGLLLGEGAKKHSDEHEKEISERVTSLFWSERDALTEAQGPDSRLLVRAGELQTYLLNPAQTGFSSSVGHPGSINVNHVTYARFDRGSSTHRIAAGALHDYWKHVLRTVGDLESDLPYTHVVSAGESLWSISKQYYATGALWHAILWRNEARLAGRTSLWVNDTLLIDRRWVLGDRATCGQLFLPGENMWSKGRSFDSSGSVWTRVPVRERRDLVHAGEKVPWHAAIVSKCPRAN